ncbi:AcrR family transcriptional regulator [Caulobacter ginsengisoli]|uniref:AcrR family transcriptional regulator n=2 Tax=Caulobacter ginsengisoli TaxID=400775 RepID=A0ABU0IV33_9CAUL|nr:AcrR family transcriptional regulator [Caulobacter ginsengisoli]
MPTTTKARIVSEARRLFAEQGYATTGLTAIRAAAGVHAGSLYHAFPSKQALLIAVLEDYLAQMDDRLVGPAWAGVDDPIERIFALLARYRQFLIDTGFMFGCPIGFIALEIHQPDDDVRALIWENFNNWMKRVRDCLDQVEFASPTDLDNVATLVLTTMEGAVMLARTARSIAPFDQSVTALRDYISRLSAEPAPSNSGQS